MTLTLILKKGLYPKDIYVKYESSITYHSKAVANVKVFADKQTDSKQMNKRTGQKLHAPDLSMRRHNKINEQSMDS